MTSSANLPAMRDVLPLPAPTESSWPSAPRLSRFEIAYGLAFGQYAGGHPDALRQIGELSDELDNCLRAALSRPPCLLSFSGGRDSSALLAWAVDLARREGWDLPVPATLVYPGDADTDESDWQNQVLEHLGVSDRLLLRVSDELDCVGPVATDALKRHGLLWPFNTHMHIPIFAAAAGGSVVTGFGGDELGRSSQLAVRAAQVLYGARRPQAKDALVVGLAGAPSLVRRVVFTRRARRDLRGLPWLTPEAVADIGAWHGRDDSRVPMRWDSILTRWWPGERYFGMVEESFRAAAAPWNVHVVHPFDDRRVLAALARIGGAAGLGDRGDLMTRVFGELVPPTILHRLSKAAFSNVLYTEIARDFARNWTGGGIDADLVDARRLRDHWLADGAADMRSMTLLQSAWLHDNPR